MRRRDLIIGGLFTASLATRVTAQPRDRTRQILLIGHAWSEPWVPGSESVWWAILIEELRRHGYAEGANLLVSRHSDWPKDWPG